MTNTRELVLWIEQTMSFFDRVGEDKVIEELVEAVDEAIALWASPANPDMPGGFIVPRAYRPDESS